jgi:uncharacterized membrane protein
MKQLFLAGLAGILFAMMFLQPVHALSLDYYGIEDVIEEDMSIYNTIVMKFDTPINHLDYYLGYKISNLTAKTSFLSADCKPVETAAGTTISCDLIGMTKENNQLTLSFQMKDAVKKLDNENRFTVNYGVNIPVNRMFVLIKLPKNNILSREGNQSFYPQDGKIATDGKRIIVFWEKENLATGSDMQFTIFYSTPWLRDMTTNVVVTGVAIVVILIMLAMLFYIRKPKQPKTEKPAVEENIAVDEKTAEQPQPVQTVSVSALNRDEEVVANIIKNEGGKAYQKVIVRNSGFSKAKVSRIVKSLRERQVIEIEPVSGRENMIKLKVPENKTEEVKKEEAEE